MATNDDRDELEGLGVRPMSKREIDAGTTIREARILARASRDHDLLVARYVLDAPHWSEPTTRVVLVSARHGVTHPRSITVRMRELPHVLEGLQEAVRLGHGEAA